MVRTEATPITSPLILVTGPPIIAGLIGVDIWIMFPIVGIFRTTETIPSFTVSFGSLPMARTRSVAIGTPVAIRTNPMSFSVISADIRTSLPSSFVPRTYLTGYLFPLNVLISARCAAVKTSLLVTRWPCSLMKKALPCFRTFPCSSYVRIVANTGRMLSITSSK